MVDYSQIKVPDPPYLEIKMNKKLNQYHYLEDQVDYSQTIPQLAQQEVYFLE